MAACDCFYPVHSRAESAFAFSRLHPEAAKEINPVDPVNPVRKYWVTDFGAPYERDLGSALHMGHAQQISYKLVNFKF